MGYLFSFLAFLILLPIIIKLPLGIKSSTKISMLVCAFALSMLGVLAVPFLGVLKVGLVLLLLSIILVLLLEKRLSDSTAPVGMVDEVVSNKPKNNLIIVQDQEDSVVTKGVTSTEDIYEEERFLEEQKVPSEQEIALNEVAVTVEKVDTDEIDDWLNSIGTNDQEVIQQSTNVEEVIELKPYKYEQDDDLDTLSELVFDELSVESSKK
ncbi:hypothetical protein [Litchfieldia alkalitelluris]|uniref:hypothetical protein n=1 Tax=Litchfieldia alkalitelluris TaxID=304268 RepID=UPI0009976500|nr:hypothetical protein [Litchfieldia alkalitelluris]